MKQMIRIVVVLGLLSPACHLGRAQQATNEAQQTPASQQIASSDSPSLIDTLDFINRVLADDSAGTMKPTSGCDVSLVRQRLGDVTLPDDTKKIPGDIGSGIPDRYEYTWTVIDPASHIRSDFNLKDIDPESVKVVEAFSIEIIAARGDETGPRLPPKDRSIITFKTSNLIRAIHERDFVDGKTLKNSQENGTGEVGFLLEPGTSARLTKDGSGDMLLFENNGRALRFAKAFKHAIELCGGKPSAF